MENDRLVLEPRGLKNISGVRAFLFRRLTFKLKFSNSDTQPFQTVKPRNKIYMHNFQPPRGYLTPKCETYPALLIASMGSHVLSMRDDCNFSCN